MKKLFSATLMVLLLATAWGGTVRAQVADADLVGKAAPDFALKNIDGKTVALKDYLATSKGVIVIFTCNHCPYAKMYEDRIVALDKAYQPQGYPVVAINPNDAKAYKEDNYKNMQKRAQEKGFTFPYLVDGTQEIAKAYGATRTPHVYLLQSGDGAFTVRYVGAIDDSAQDASKVTVKFLEDAIAKLESGSMPEPSYTKAVGCGIKWLGAEKH